MKRAIALSITVLLTFHGFGQTDFRKKIKELEENNQIREALQIADSVMNQAARNNNAVDFTYAAIQKLKFLPQIHELGTNETYDSLKTFLAKAPERAIPVMKFLEASLLERHYASSRWQIDQKPDDGPDNTLFEEMSRHDFQRKVTDLIGEAITKSGKSTESLTTYKELYSGDDYYLKYFPTFTDQLYFQGIALLSRFEQDNYEFELKQLTDIQDRTATSVTIKNILKWYSQWYSANANNPEIAGFIELERILWLHNRNNHIEKMDFYESALSTLKERYAHSEISADILFALAKHYKQISDRYSPNDSTLQKYYPMLQRAWETAQQITNDFPETFTAKQAKLFMREIEIQQLSVSVAQYQTAGRNMAISVSYANISKVKISIKTVAGMDIINNTDYQRIKIGTAVYEAWFELPKADDFYKHTTTLVIPFGKAGSYILEAQTEGELKNQPAFAHFHVTGMNMFAEQTAENNTTVWIVDRFTGNPVPKAEVELLSFRYNRRDRGFISEPFGKYSIANGKVSVPTKSMSEARIIKVVNGVDTLWQNMYVPFNQSGNQQQINRIELFSDRAIYRPGQSVQVKGICYKGAGEKWSVVAGAAVTLTARDDNYTEIGLYQAITNEFGSFSMTIPLSENIKPGYVSLNTQYGNLSLRVESYRRYTFDAEFVNPKKPVLPGNEAVIELAASTFSGVKLNQLKVTGDVKFSSWRVWWLPQNNKTVAVIDTGTDENGKVLIRFKTNKNIDYQIYNINLTVTTPAGESREFAHQFVVSSNPYSLSLSAAKLIKGDKLPTISIKQNNGGTCTESVSLRLERLLPPKNIVIPSNLPIPDKHTLTQPEWQKQMPWAEYSGELDIEKFVVEKEMWSYTGTPEKAELPLHLADKLTEGAYRITLEINGKTDIQYFRVMDTDKKRLDYPEILDIYTNTTRATVGQEITVVFVSSVENAPLWYGISAGNKTREQKNMVLKTGKHTVKIPVTAEHEGKIFVNAVVAFGGEIVTKHVEINVERWSKQLKVETLSMRNHIVPGTREEWTFRLSTPDKRKFDAEVLASMYDKSLDVFAETGSRSLAIYYPTINTTRYASGTNRLYSGRVSGQLFSLVEPSKLYWNFLGMNGFDYGRNFGDGVFFMTKGMQKSTRTMEAEGVPAPTMMLDMAEDMLITERAESIDVPPAPEEKGTTESKPEVPQLRTNFNETAFFYPALRHNEKGEFVVKFDVPDALTSWKLQLFAHDKTLATGYFETTVQTKKPLMVMPIFPRFAYTGDSLVINASVFNQTDSVLIIKPGAEIENSWGSEKLAIILSSKQITLKPGEEAAFRVAFRVPSKPGFLTARVFATAGTFTDGEEKIIPVWPDRQYVTNALALWGKPKATTEYTFVGMMPTQKTPESNLKLTLEMSTNPTWYAIQSLPFFDNPHPNSPIALIESIFGVQTGDYLAVKYPVIRKTLDIWQKAQPDALQSKLLSNKELKITDIEQTPWYNDALDEQEQQRKVALFLDKNKIQDLTALSIENLKKLQASSGGFSWIPGWQTSPYITLYVVELIGRLNKINPELYNHQPDLKIIADNALRFLDSELDRDYEQLLRSKTDTSKYMSPYYTVRHLYVKNQVSSNFRPTSAAEKFYFRHAQMHAMKYNLYGQAVLGILARSTGDIKLATKIYKGLEGSATIHPEKGIFWRQNIQGWEWYQAPITTQVRIMEFYSQMQAPTEKVDAMKIWLIQHKRTHRWNDGSSTAEAVYALVSGGRNWLENKGAVTITLSNLKINSSDYNQHAGTGYFKTTFEGETIPQNINAVSIANPNSNPVYGGLYAQFYERFENIKPWQQNLTISTQYFTFTQNGEETTLTKAEESKIKQGQKVRVRMTLTTDRELEYVVAQLPFATCFEQVEQMSGFQWKGGQNYYVQNYDNRAEFFFYRLQQGVTVIEFDLYVLRPGEYRSAPAAVQSLYAPEFGAHSGGVKVVVE
jgi:hypothetical protein